MAVAGDVRAADLPADTGRLDLSERALDAPRAGIP